MKKIFNIYIPILFLIYIFVNMLLNLFGAEICKSEGCSIVKSLTTIEPNFLNILGLLFASLILFLSQKSFKSDSYSKYLNYILFCGFVFESVLIIFQIRLLDSLCYYCLGIFGFITILSLYHLERVRVISTFLMILIAFFMLKFIPYKAILDESTTTYMFTSKSCKHCIVAKEYLNSNSIEFKNLDVEKIENQNFLTQFGIDSIPTMLIKNGQNFELIKGDRAIIDYFESLKNINFHQEEGIFSIQPSSEEEECRINTICE
jgi:glutaredoxin